MFIGPSLADEGSEPPTEEELDKILAIYYAGAEKKYAKLSKILARFAVNYEKSLKEKRKPLGMPDDKPKRSSPKSED